MKPEIAISLVGTVAAVLAVMQAAHDFKQGAEQYTAANSFLVRSDLEDRVLDLLIFMSDLPPSGRNETEFAARLISVDAALSRAHSLKANGGLTLDDWNGFMGTVCPQLEIAAFLRTTATEVYLVEFEKRCADF